MNYINTNKFLWPVLFAAGVFTAIFVMEITAQDGRPGDNDPAAGPAVGVGNTLEDIFNSTPGSPGKNFGVAIGAAAHAYNAETNMWVSSATISSVDTVVETNGNIGAKGSIGAAAWSPSSGWIGQGLSGIVDIIGSNGNFCIWGTNTVYAWDRDDPGSWEQYTGTALGGINQVVASNGNFCALGSSARAAAWTPANGWTLIQGGGTSVGAIGAD